MDVNRLSPAFDSAINVHVSSLAGQPVSVHQLWIRILHATAPRHAASSATSAQSERVIHIEVTDEQDHCFLYLLDIAEGDFHHLKRDQAILVDFSDFPSKLIELLELSMSRQSSEQDRQFSAKLDLTTGVFSVVESNKFKQVSHIALQLRPGNDSAVKAYLSSRLAMTLGVASKQGSDILKLNHLLLEEKTAKAKIESELRDQRISESSQIETLRAQFENDISRIQLINLKSKEETRQQHDLALNNLKEAFNTLQDESSRKIRALEEKNAELQQTCGTLEFRIKDLTQKLESSNSDRERILTDLQKFSLERRQLEDTKSSLERDVARLGAQVEGLTRQLEDKTETNNKALALQRSSEDSRDMLKQQLSMMANTITELQDKVKSQAADMRQGGQDLSRLQQDFNQLVDKLKVKTEVIRRQENEVEKLRKKVGDTERDLSNSKSDVSSLQVKIASLQRQLDDANALLSEKDQQLESNKQVISYLNEEQSKWQLGFNTQSNKVTYDIHNVSYSPSNLANTFVSKSPAQYEYTPKATSSKVSPPISNRREAEKDLISRGLENLGLGNKLDEFHLNSFSESNLFPAAKIPGDFNSNKTFLRGTDLRDLDYYADAERLDKSSKFQTVSPGNLSPAPKGSSEAKQTASQKNYAWKSPDWIDSALAGGSKRP